MLLPFSIVSSPSFQNFVSTVQRDPKWRPPHRAKVSGILQPQAHDKIMQTITSFVNDCNYVSMTTDGWTGPKGQSYWSLTVVQDIASSIISSYRSSSLTRNELLYLQLE
jgi:hypothetical protein